MFPSFAQVHHYFISDFIDSLKHTGLYSGKIYPIKTKSGYLKFFALIPRVMPTIYNFNLKFLFAFQKYIDKSLSFVPKYQQKVIYIYIYIIIIIIIIIIRKQYWGKIQTKNYGIKGIAEIKLFFLKCIHISSSHEMELIST